MRSPLKALRHLLSVEREPKLDLRLLQLLSLVATFISALIIPFNHLEHLSIYHHLTVVTMGVTSLVIFSSSLKGHHHFGLFIFGLVVVLNICWFADGGSLSSISTYFFLAIIAICIFFSGWRRLAIAGFFLVDIGILYTLDFLHPEWIIPFKSSGNRFLETASGTLISLLCCLLVMLVVITSYHHEQRNLAEANRRLQSSLDEIRTLQGLLPICAWCKKVRDDEGLWTQLEQYFSERTDLAFTHGLCPDCAREQIGRLKEELPALHELRTGASPDRHRDSSST